MKTESPHAFPQEALRGSGRIMDDIEAPGVPPADRLIVATALSFGARLLSNDARMRDAGLVDVV